MGVRSFSLLAFIVATCASFPVCAAQSLDARNLTNDQLRELCSRVSGVTLLAQTQMISSPDAEWRRRSRQALTIEHFIMGVAPLDPTKCYAIASAGRRDNPEDSFLRRAFEVREFSDSSERTLIMVIGKQYPH